MMDCLQAWLTVNNKFLGVEWPFWQVVGWLGNVIFFSRFFVQWWATEKRKQVVVPNSFWWLSLIGSLLLLAYGLRRRGSVFIFDYAFTWIPYIRNLIIRYRTRRRALHCSTCSAACASYSLFSAQCGLKLQLASNAG